MSVSPRWPSRPHTPGFVEVAAKVNALLDIAQINLGDAAATYVAEDAAAASRYTGV